MKFQNKDKNIDNVHSDLTEFGEFYENAENVPVPEKPILTEQEIIKKNKRKTKAVVAVFVMVLVVGVAGNWYYQNTDVTNAIDSITNITNKKTLGEAELVDATTVMPKESEYFSSARVDRQNARDEALEKLQKIIDSSDSGEQAKKKASDQIARISEYISIENKIETLVTAKGVNNCLAVVNNSGERVDVIVDVEDLSETMALQIKEIAISQLSCNFENVSIIQSK